MSIQFRSRISGQFNPPTIIDKNTIGWCCGVGSSTRSQCDAVSGYFIPTATNSNDCPVAGPCLVGLVSSMAGSCCHWIEDNGIYLQKCVDTSSKLECINLHEGSDEGLGYSFYPGSSCITEGGNIVCNSVTIKTQDLISGCNPDDSTGCFSSLRSIGNCCTQTRNGIDCTITDRENCYGFWSPPVNGVQSCVNKSPCSGVYFSGFSGGIDPARASLTTISSSTNPIETLPSIGELYQGGLYVGIFSPGTPVNTIGSTVYGNQLTGAPSNYRARGTGQGTKEKSWILIACPSDFTSLSYNTEAETTKEISSSFYDGLYNTYDSTISENNNLLYRIKNATLNGFKDWYLPSQDELAFYFKNIAYGYSISGFEGLDKEQYLTSTAFTANGLQTFDGIRFMVSQMADSAQNYGKTNAIYRKKSSGIRLFRRIYLES